MQITVGNHLKMNAPRHLRERLRDFYTTVLECQAIAGPSPDFDLFRFTGGFVVGLFYGDDSAVLGDDELLKATWLELKASDPGALRQRLLDFGVKTVEYPDPGRFYFQAPGGSVWRVAPLGGGIRIGARRNARRFRLFFRLPTSTSIQHLRGDIRMHFQRLAPAVFAFLFVVALAALPRSRAADEESKPIPDVGPTGAPVEVEGTFKFTEGPTTDVDGIVYFTDVPAQKVFKISPDNKTSVARENTNYANGLMFNAAGEIVCCQRSGVVAWDPKTKNERVLASEYDGKPFNGPNDLVIDRTGGVYFTDPSFALDGKSNQGVHGVFYIAADGKLTRVIDDVVGPNGIILSPDEKTLYVLPFPREDMMAYPVEAPGKLGAGRKFCKIEQPAGKKGAGGDGCAVDARGNLYIAAATGVQVFDPTGKMLGTIKVPKTPSNCEFGGKDLKTLYVTARTNVYAVPMAVAGHRFPGGAKK